MEQAELDTQLLDVETMVPELPEVRKCLDYIYPQDTAT